MNVVLPAPFGPMRPVTRPAREIEIEAAQDVESRRTISSAPEIANHRILRMAGRAVDEHLRRQRRQHPLGDVEQIDERAAEEHERRRVVRDDDGEEAHRAMRHVADAVVVEIVAAIRRPVVAG